MNILFLNPYSVNNITVFSLHLAPESDKRARLRAPTPSRPVPLT